MDEVRRLADAVLYEGYLLWPYRRSALKNQRRWTFGGVHPPAWSSAHPDDRAVAMAQCLVEGDAPAVDVEVRFLQIVRRQARDAAGQPVDALVAGGVRHVTWDEAVERRLDRPGPFDIPAGCEVEDLGDDGALEHRWETLSGEVVLAVEPVREGVHRVTVAIANMTLLGLADGHREAVLRRSLCSAHAVLRVRGGSFVSMADPPPALAGAAAACCQDGLWPVVVGAPGAHDTVLASPLMLEDHPRIAPESPGDLFDGGEVDELLVLNILALTDAEKAEMRASDPRAREILDRTEALTPEQLLRLHGVRR
jgi:hypothetical protein